jgi:hypothetical protein
MARQLRAFAGAMLAALILMLPAAAMAVTSATSNWTAYRNAKHGFELRYPAELLTLETVPANGDGVLWTTPDGRAKLFAGAVVNEGGDTLESYRRFLIEDTYAGWTIDYAPVRRNWFVLSGQRDGEMVYERVTFACAGRMIYGWQLRYPVAERALYDRIVEGVHRTYQAGRGEDGRC